MKKARPPAKGDLIKVIDSKSPFADRMGEVVTSAIDVDARKLVWVVFPDDRLTHYSFFETSIAIMSRAD